MIKMINAYTEEVDEINDGITEILGQIDFAALKKNSIGIASCHFDFIDSEFISALCEKLPFDLIGMSTLASSNRHGQGMYAFSLTVLTSDDVIFESAMAESLKANDYYEKVSAAYSNAAGKLPGKPSMILTLFPFSREVNGSLLHKSFDEICGGIPFWGSLAVNADLSFDDCAVFRNNVAGGDNFAMILMHGEVDPEFIVVSIPAKNIRKNRGIITCSDGCILKEVNGIPPLKFLESLGVVIMKDAPAVWPLLVYYEGSTEPVALGIYIVNDDGSLLCGGEMTLGASISIGEITAEGILESAAESLDRALGCGKRDGALFLPCISRNLMLAPNHNDEMNLITSKMGNGKIMPFMTAYSGGEICPVRDEAGVYRNRFHNYTFSACII